MMNLVSLMAIAIVIFSSSSAAAQVASEEVPVTGLPVWGEPGGPAAACGDLLKDCVATETIRAAYFEGILNRTGVFQLLSSAKNYKGQYCEGDVIFHTWEKNGLIQFEWVLFQPDYDWMNYDPNDLEYEIVEDGAMCIPTVFWEVRRHDGVRIQLHIPESGDGPGIMIVPHIRHI